MKTRRDGELVGGKAASGYARGKKMGRTWRRVVSRSSASHAKQPERVVKRIKRSREVANLFRLKLKLACEAH